ncbi:CpXC domain-containing protein [Candidatus Viridilinea mediisalina]|uniref:CpXC domain-containing protein n=1 Tax=Candidatus Viridilinea mediisalina TaxID=2024553 RepID=A0A2A6RNF7_9CHLR|nr:CpXC domain-containing protein [Candidatus Viridilinea mediisalina]PDW04473.1 hypothetical protein CJ255_03590 [Candidatus Viridilinea mediisalina]
MPIAYQEQSQLTCPACGAEFTAALWLILDAQEAPEALEALLREELNVVTCSACGQRGPAGTPLLFHDALNRRVIFAPAPASAEHEWREQARELHALLVGSLPEEQRNPYLAEVEIAQDLGGVARLLRRAAKRRRGEAAGGGEARGGAARGGAARGEAARGEAARGEAARGEAARGEAARGEAAMREAAGGTEAEVPALLVAVEALLSANSNEELDQVLAAYPLLLDPTSDMTLAQLVDVAIEQRAYDVAESLRTARALLHRLVTLVQTAPQTLPPVTTILAQTEPDLAHSTPPVSELAPPAPEPSSLPTAPVAQGLHEEAITALLHTQSAAELAAVVATYPALAHPSADRSLAERIDLALDEGNERLALLLEERREALALLHSAPPHHGPSLDEALEALLIAADEAAIAAALEDYPILLEESAAQALWQFAAEARASGDEELARYALECRTMLQRVRDGLKE